MTYYLFTFYVTRCTPDTSPGQRTWPIEAENLKKAFRILIDQCDNCGFVNWFVVYVFSEDDDPTVRISGSVHTESGF